MAGKEAVTDQGNVQPGWDAAGGLSEGGGVGRVVVMLWGFDVNKMNIWHVYAYSWCPIVKRLVTN